MRHEQWHEGNFPIAGGGYLQASGVFIIQEVEWHPAFIGFGGVDEQVYGFSVGVYAVDGKEAGVFIAGDVKDGRAGDFFYVEIYDAISGSGVGNWLWEWGGGVSGAGR